MSRILKIRKMIKMAPCPVVFDKMEDSSFFSPDGDVICINGEHGDDEAKLFRTLAHEMTHAASTLTGEDIWNEFGTVEYAKEELVAEAGASMLMKIFKIRSAATERLSKDYMAGWLYHTSEAGLDDVAVLDEAYGKAEKRIEALIVKFNAKDAK